MNDKERQNLINMIAAMSEEELKIVATTIPVQLCMERMVEEIVEVQSFKEKIKDFAKNC